MHGCTQETDHHLVFAIVKKELAQDMKISSPEYTVNNTKKHTDSFEEEEKHQA